MATTLINSVSKVMNPAWITGPIFDKELRVSSRRRRNYWLRFAYMAVLTLFVVMVWLSAVEMQGMFSAAYRVSRMSMAGIQITGAIVGFQFAATQLIAVIMLSTSISDEIYNRTLGLLMTTPINSFQIVMGKLFSKLLQLVLLLAISLPLLAIVRVFGGVPWGFVISSLCITLTAVIFAGKPSLGAAEPGELGGRIRPVRGSPVIWKELRAPLIQGGKIKSMIGLVLTIIALLITYAVSMREDVLDEDFAHIVYILIFVIMGLITNAVLSATTITSEKEARSWPILLATSLDDWQILLGKAVGVFRRCLPIWLFLAGHLVLFVSVRYIHPIAIVHLAMLVAWIVVFLSGSGLYFSARLKRTTSAVVANFCLALALWAIIPMLLGLASEITRESDVLEAYVSTNPVVQAIVIMEGAGGSENAWSNISDLDYDWPHDYDDSWLDWDKAGGTSAFLLITMLAYISFGFLFAWRAKCRFRRNIF